MKPAALPKAHRQMLDNASLSPYLRVMRGGVSKHAQIDRLRRRLSESQNHHCACCGVAMTLRQGFGNSANTIKIDPTQPRNYKNSVALCVFCSGFQAAYPSLMAYFEHVQRHGRPATKYDRHREQSMSGRARRSNAEYRQKIEVYRRIIRERCHEPAYNGKPKGLEKLSLDRVVEIAEQAADRLINTQRRPKVRFSKKRRTRNLVPRHRVAEYGHIRTNRDLRLYLSGCQNHRCCYCHTTMEDIDHKIGLAHTVTIEHVLASEDGGSDHIDNLVAACGACNTRRGRMKLSAEAFYEHVQRHGNDHVEYNRSARFNRIEYRLDLHAV